jgi:hypothetical protein
MLAEGAKAVACRRKTTLAPATIVGLSMLQMSGSLVAVLL